MHITREQAQGTLYDLINSGILDKEIEEKLQDVVNCIDAENEGLFLWGADDDADELFICRRDDLYSDELAKRLGAIFDKYKIKEYVTKESEDDESC